MSDIAIWSMRPQRIVRECSHSHVRLAFVLGDAAIVARSFSTSPLAQAPEAPCSEPTGRPYVGGRDTRGIP